MSFWQSHLTRRLLSDDVNIVGQLITFDMLPDDVLLEIFDFYVDKDAGEDFKRIESWITLAHVCRCWRSIVFRSPRRLNLRLLYTTKTRMRDTLDIWPPFPLAIYHTDRHGTPDASGVDNIIAALVRNDRVGQIHIKKARIGMCYLFCQQCKSHSWS